MAAYGTKEYYEEKVVEAETKVELLSYAFVHRIKDAETAPNIAQLRHACKVLLEACDELDEVKERYNAYCGNESGSQESA